MKARSCVAGAAIVIMLTGCGNQSPGGWKLKSAKDPISGETTTSAVRRVVADNDAALVGDIELACHQAGGSGDPFKLFLTLTTYSAKADKGELPPAPLTTDAVEFRIDDLGGSSIKESEQVESAFNNQFKVNFAAAYGGSPKIAEKLSSLIPTDGVAGFGVLLASTANLQAAAEQGGATSPSQATASALKAVIDNPNMAAELKGPLAQVSSNYKWGFQTLVLRFRAKLPSGSGNDYVIKVPLADPQVVQVAEACGWHANPMPLRPVAASAQLGAIRPDQGEQQPISGADAEGQDAGVAAEVADKSSRPPNGRPATCDVNFGGDDAFKGPCLYEPTGHDGSFMIYRAGDAEIIGNTSAIKLSITKPGVAMVTLVNASGAGHTDIDEPFVRSKERPACWVQTHVEEDAASVCVR